MTAYIAATLPPPSIDPRLRKHDPPTATAQHSVAGGLGDTTGPTPRRLSSLPLTDALAGDSSWYPRRRRHAVPEEHATDTSHMTQQHRDSPAGHGEIRWVMTPKRVIAQHGAPSAVAPPVARSSWPTRATYPHGGPACYPYAPANGMREQWRILIYSVCAGQPS